MSETKWTPGPWNGRDIKVSDQDAAGISICFTYPPREEYRANARLIAAAPELYEALQVAELALRERGLRVLGEYKQIESALAKARGEQP